jgi:hypothetical protein
MFLNINPLVLKDLEKVINSNWNRIEKLITNHSSVNGFTTLLKQLIIVYSNFFRLRFEINSWMTKKKLPFPKSQKYSLIDLYLQPL